MNTPADLHRDNARLGFIDMIGRVAAAAGEEGASVGEIVDRLDERAFALLLLLLAIPCLVPGLPGAQIIAVPILLLALQVVAGRREPWLPGWFLRARVKKSWLDGLAGFSVKRLRWTERVSAPRLTLLATGFGERIVGLVIALVSITIMLPITNTLPSLAITLMAVGLLQRDGLFTLVGATLGLAWVGLLGAIVGGVLLGAGFALRFVAENAPWLADWLGIAAP